MKFAVAAHTDTGIKKQVNQDSLCVKVADTKKGQAVMGVVCDGMGGLKKGELASATVVCAFSVWFETEFPKIVEKQDVFEAVKKQWDKLIHDNNEKIRQYGIKNGIALGTTLTAVLWIENHYLIVNIGDSRAYEIGKEISCLTTDHTLLQKELQQKRITEEQMEKDPRRSILIQCIGAAEIVEPEYIEGETGSPSVYVICSDGFRHKLKKEEMLGVLNPLVLDSRQVMKNTIIDLVELNKSRGETDNISVLLIKAY